MDKHIVKRAGHKEPYDDRKVYGSCYAACLNVHIKDKEEAERICGEVTAEVNQWVENTAEFSSDEIFKKVTEALGKRNKDAGFMYQTHRDIS